MHNMKYRPALYAHADTLDRVKRAGFPVLLIYGLDSEPFHHRIIRILEATFPDVTVVGLPGGHGPHLGDGFDPFLQQLVRFQRRVARQASAA
jgi:pimeloyl-ACP methyl ester carboxylesterase